MRLFGNAIQNYYGTLAISTPGGGSMSINTAGNVNVGAPSSGTALTVNGKNAASTTALIVVSAAGSGTSAGDLAINRTGSTINTVAQGPNIVLYDGTYTSLLQSAGGQTELWQNNGSFWSQIFKIASAGNFTLNSPTSGTALTVIGNAAANTAALAVVSAAGSGISAGDLAINRTGSTINTVAQGPNIVLYDGTYTSLIQSAGGQMEFWQYIGGWGQSAFFDTNRNLNINNGAGSRSPVYAGIPQNLQSGTTYTLVLSDANKHIYGNNASAKTFTIPANSSVAFPVGTAVTFIANSASMTIAITTDTLILSGAGTTGSRTLAANSMATAIKITSTAWIISGSGLT